MQMIAIGMFVLSCLSLNFFCPSVLLRGVGGLVRGCVRGERGRERDILLLALSTYTSFSFLSRWCHWSWSLRRIRFCFAKGWACGVGHGIHGKYIVTPSFSLSRKSLSCTLSIHLKHFFPRSSVFNSSSPCKPLPNSESCFPSMEPSSPTLVASWTHLGALRLVGTMLLAGWLFYHSKSRQPVSRLRSGPALLISILESGLPSSSWY